MRRFSFPLLLVLGALGGLPLALGRADEPEPKTSPAAGIGRPTGRLPTLGVSHLDVERAEDREAALLEKLGPLGRMWVKTVPIRWGRIQPSAPDGSGARYDWSEVDRAMLLWQLAGFEPVPVLSPRSPWATEPVDHTAWAHRLARELSPSEAEVALRTGVGVAPPRLARWKDWERFVAAFVERYDADGRADMPGLRRPLRYVQILDRVDLPSFWLGSADDYMRLLHHARLGVDQSNPKTRIIHAAIDLHVAGYAPVPPDDAAWRFRVEQQAPKSPPAARLEALRAFEIVQRTIEMPRLFDVMAHVGTRNLQDDEANLHFLRALLDRNGGSEKRIWLVDAPITKLARSRVPRVPATPREEERIRRRWLPVSRLPGHSEQAQALAWVHRGQAFDLVRTYCRARAAGADAVLFFPRADRLAGAPQKPDDDADGLPKTLIASRDDGSFVTYTRGALWYAWRQLWQHTRDHSRVEETPIGASARAIVFQVPVARRNAFVTVLLRDSRLSWAGSPGQPSKTSRVAVPLPRGRYLLEACDTGTGRVVRRQAEVTDGLLVVELGPAPLYVIPLD